MNEVQFCHTVGRSAVLVLLHSPRFYHIFEINSPVALPHEDLDFVGIFLF